MWSNFSDSRFSVLSSSTTHTALSTYSSASDGSSLYGTSNAAASRGDVSADQPTLVSSDLTEPQKPLPPLPTLPEAPKSQQNLPSRFSTGSQGAGSTQLPGSSVIQSRSNAHNARHDRWCTTGEHKNPFTTYRGFAKHENEHDQAYVFLPNGPIEQTSWGPQCALCEEPNPDKAHLEGHNTLKYEGWTGRKITRSRKGNFEELLKRHKTSDDKIKTLTVKWRQVLKKKAYSCGFCINLFNSLSDRSSHIDREHYAQGKHFEDWNDNLVIKGLLLQRGIREECTRLFSSNPCLPETPISWPPNRVDDLQLRLEMGEEDAKKLAVDVFREANDRARRSRIPAPSQQPQQSRESIPAPSTFTTGISPHIASVTDFSNHETNTWAMPQADTQHPVPPFHSETMLDATMSSPLNPIPMQNPQQSFDYPSRSSSLPATNTDFSMSLNIAPFSSSFESGLGFVPPQLSNQYFPANNLEGPSMMDVDRSDEPGALQDYLGYNPASYNSASHIEPIYNTMLDGPQESEGTLRPKRKLSDRSARQTNSEHEPPGPTDHNPYQYQQ